MTNVIVMVSDGYPIKFSANNTKGEFIAMGLKEAGCRVAMLDEIYGTKGLTECKIGISDSGIDYLLMPRIGRLTAPLHTIPMIWKYLCNRKVKGGQNHIIIGMKKYPLYIIICFMACLQGYSRSSLFHEWHIQMGYKKARMFSEPWWKDMTFGYLLNCIFPIGHFLEEKAKMFKKPMMTVPVMGGYERKPFIPEFRNTFTYCCGAGYLLHNTLVLDAFRKLIVEDSLRDLKLLLVLVGNAEDIKSVRKMIEMYHLNGHVIIKSQLSQADLYRSFDESIGLLIPLDPDSLQDVARFSQKIAEYVASKRPIITSDVGEIPYYFKDKESAVIVPFSVEGYYEGMKMLADDPAIADKIGEEGYEIGCQFFDYKAVGNKMKELLESL